MAQSGYLTKKVKCPICSKRFDQKLCDGKPYTCSASCGAKFRTAKRPVAKLGKRAPSLQVPKVCPVCGKDFRAAAKVVCCSRSCARYLEWDHGERHRVDHPPKRPRVDRKPAPGGYVWHRVPSDHPSGRFTSQKGTAKWILEHRFVMEQILGRYLSDRERVHHRNGVRDDNRPENLELWTLDHKDPPGVRASEVKHCPSCTCAAAP